VRYFSSEVKVTKSGWVCPNLQAKPLPVAVSKAVYTPAMPVEIEAKIRLSDPDALHAKLRALDAVLDQRVVETNTYFDTPDGTLKSTDQGLRVRVEVDRDSGQTRTMFTHKGPRSHGRFKSRTETEVGVSDARAAAEMLAALGYQPVLTFEKRRTRYLLGHCRVEIDTLPHLGTFVEIEGRSENDVVAVQNQLGLADIPLIRASYIAMLATYLRESHLSTKYIKLEDQPESVV